MSADFYRMLHFAGLFCLFATLGAQLIYAMTIGGKSAESRRFLAVFHGVGLLLVIVSGFGMLAKLGLGFQGWTIGKLGVWMFMGVAGAIAARKKEAARTLWFLTILLGILAAYLARYKPF